MTVLLVLFTFTTFLLIDHFRTRHAVQPVLQVAPAKHERLHRVFSPPWLAASRCRRISAITPVTPGR